MPNAYLAECHQFISTELTWAEAGHADALQRGDRARALWFEGRREELVALRAFLSQHFDLSTQRYY